MPSLMLKVVIIFVVVALEAHGCHMRLKDLDEEEVILCSPMFSTGVTWLFNNQSEVGSNVAVTEEGRFIVIPSSDISVYGDYSCFQNSSFVNCSSLYFSGFCNTSCAGLKTDINGTTTFPVGSTITFYLTIKIYLSPIDSQGIFLLFKDDESLSRDNFIFDSQNVVYHLHDAQPSDSGVYYAEYISQHVTLLTNRLFINIAILNPSITSQQHTSTSTSMSIAITTVEIIPTTTVTVHTNVTELRQTPTASPNKKSNSDNTVVIIIVVVVGVVVVMLVGVVVVIVTVLICKRRRSNGSGSTGTPSIHSPVQETQFYE